MQTRNLMAAATALALAISACGTNGEGAAAPRADVAQTEKGTVELALVGRGSSGATYVLRSAIIMVQGPETTEFFDTETNPGQEMYTSNVTAGGYSVFLQEGWRLDRMDVDGTTTPDVPAILASSNPQQFQVQPGQRTHVDLRFRAGDDVVNFGSYEIGVVVDDGDGNSASGFCSSDADCGAGETCCSLGFLGSASTLADGEACPMPDLTVSESTARGSIELRNEIFAENSCAIAEGCVGGPGVRRLLAFSTETPNIGNADLVLGSPSEDFGFEYSSCHGHYHFEGYAAYELLDQGGAVVATGHKQAFCLLDSHQVSGSRSPRFHCSFQGITAGWSDIYGAGLDCQWVDVTGVPAGDYVLAITINPEHVIAEANYDNNRITVPVTLTEDRPPTPDDVLSPCEQTSVGRDCGFSIDTDVQGAPCTPGEVLTLGCGCGDGTCVGDPVLRVCEGDGACTAMTALANADDTCGTCPSATIVCPASGRVTALVGPYAPANPGSCDVAVRHGAVASPDAGVGFDAGSLFPPGAGAP